MPYTFASSQYSVVESVIKTLPEHGITLLNSEFCLLTSDSLLSSSVLITHYSALLFCLTPIHEFDTGTIERYHRAIGYIEAVRHDKLDKIRGMRREEYRI